MTGANRGASYSPKIMLSLDSLSEFCRKSASEGLHPVEVVLPTAEWEELAELLVSDRVTACRWFEFNGVKFRPSE